MTNFDEYSALVAGEQFGEIRDAFIKAGIPAISCDLDETRKVGPHFKGDWRIAISAKVWDLIIFHPECTALCSAGNHVYAEGKPRHAERLAALEYTAEMWELVKQHSHHAALENPVGVLPMKPWHFTQPYLHGDDASKRTGFLLHNLEPLKPAPWRRVPPRWVCCKQVIGRQHARPTCPICGSSLKPNPRWANQRDDGQNKLGESKDRKRLRAATYPGIAETITQQWGIPSCKSSIRNSSFALISRPTPG